MTRRRLILAASVAVVALGAAWWLTPDGLSVEERRLVGSWRHYDPESGERSVMLLLPDRQYSCVRLALQRSESAQASRSFLA
jgi:hypothetical protein